jgi:hypothetical protein
MNRDEPRAEPGARLFGAPSRAVRRASRWLIVCLAIFVLAPPLFATITINNDQPIFTDTVPFTVSGTTDAPVNTPVAVAIDTNPPILTTVAPGGTWYVTVPSLPTGTYTIAVTIANEHAEQILRVQLPGNVQRQFPVEPPRIYGTPDVAHPESALEMTDRWRIAPPPYELDEHSTGQLDPYHRNILKGDLPILGTNDLFFVFTGISDSLAESRTLPTPSGVSAKRSGSVPFFGSDDQNVYSQSVDLSFEVFQGDTGFKPIQQRLKVTLIGNLNKVRVEENAILKPDVRRGTVRSDSQLALQEIFYERKLRDLSPNFDFVSIRAGSQPFSSDFRGFIFSDTNAGVRLFGNYASNRFQYNLAVFDRREKDTNSGLNTLTERRGQQVLVANVYWQDFLRKGFTEEFSIHQLHDRASFKYDRNGILVRPAPVGVFTPHSIDATYLGAAGLGHLGRINVDHALYLVFGRDSLNPIAGPDPKLKDHDSVRIGAGMAALELSLDRDWYRPRLGFFYATGDRHPRDRRAAGFDSIYDAANFAGGGFSFFNRMGIKLAGSGVSLVERGSLLPSLRSSKDEGQPNFVNPGVQLITAGVDVDVSPRVKAIFTANDVRMAATESVEAVLFQGNIHRDLGRDLSIGVRFRPFLNNNMIVVGGAAAFLPGRGFKDIYESGRTLYHVFTNLILTF